MRQTGAPLVPQRRERIARAGTTAIHKGQPYKDIERGGTASLRGARGGCFCSRSSGEGIGDRMTAGPMKCDQTAKVGSAVPSAPRWACGVVDTYIRKSVNFAKIVAASHALSLSPWPPLHTMERGERGVRAGR